MLCDVNKCLSLSLNEIYAAYIAYLNGSSIIITFLATLSAGIVIRVLTNKYANFHAMVQPDISHFKSKFR